MTDGELRLKSVRYRQNILRYITHAGAGHTGGSLSCVDILNVLYNRVLRASPERVADPHRDRYVQSKGHSVEALYVVLADRGFFPEADLETLCRYKSPLVGHPTRKIPGIEMNTGALGHGLPIAAGMALAGKLDGAPYRVFTLLGDGELAEGSNWEAAMAAAHYKLDNLTAILDCNTLQITGRTHDVCSSEPVDEKFRSFGWAVETVDGHDLGELAAVLARRPLSGQPRCVIARTVKGRGVSFMADVVKWHHGVPNQAEYEQAVAELEQAERELMEAQPSSAPAPSMYSPAAKARADALGLRLGRANLEEFADTLLALAKENRNILAVTSDSRGSGKLGPFGRALPRQIVEVGIAEQNLVGMSAGLAAAGKKPFAVSPACFLTARALEQIKNDVCYSDVPVAVIGISAGVSYGALGSTHHSLHDFAALRAIHNIAVVAPADNLETREAIRIAAGAGHPMYLRFGKAAVYNLHPPGTKFEAGRAITLREGRDAALVGTGETVIHCLLAAALLADEGVECRVISMHTVKPLDADAVLRRRRACSAIVTAEEHSVHGGLGEACAAAPMQAGVAVPFRIVGLPDEDTVTGSQADIFRHYGLSMEGLAATVRSMLSPAEASR